MKKSILMITCCLGASCVLAQGTPKWANKAKKAVFSIVTYNAENQIKGNGNGFYIDEKGTALTDYTLFEGAARAVIINAQGKEIPVSRICGANAIYDVLKFRTEGDKKLEMLKVAQTPAKVGETVYLLPYATQKSSTLQTGKVTSVDSIGTGSFYYTLAMKAGEKTVSCPIMNAQGEVLGMIQKNSSADSDESYAIGATFGTELGITAFSANDASLNKIGIRKALPENEEQAVVYLMMNSGMEAKEYALLLDEFMNAFPNNPEGYLRKGASVMNSDAKEAEEWYKKAIDCSKDKGETTYNIAKNIYNQAIADIEAKKESPWTLRLALDKVNEAKKIKESDLYAVLEGDIYFGMKKYAEAYACYEKFNKTKLATATSFYSAAKAKQGMEGTKPAEVIALLDSTLARFAPPYTSEAAIFFFERAELKMQNEQYREAVIDYSLFNQAFKGEVTANFYYKREQAEIQCKMYQQAIADINKAVSMEPKNLDFWMEKGSVHMRVAQFDEALKAFKQANELDKKSAEVLRMKGYCQLQLKQKSEGIATLQQAASMGDKVAKDLIKKYK